MINNKSLNYSDITLVPRVLSNIASRSDVSLASNLCGIPLKVPIINSPMLDVASGNVAKKLRQLGAIGCLHRFCSIQDELFEFINSRDIINTDCAVICSVGVSDDWQERFEQLYANSARLFLFDVANGCNKKVINAINWVKSHYYSDVKIIAGNVASYECFKILADTGIHAVRVGLSGGSQCSTKTETGVFYGMVSSLMECFQAREDGKYKCDIIACGGISEPQDVAKALIWSDCVMIGSLIAQTEDSPGRTHKEKVLVGNSYHDVIFKLYRGAASWSHQFESGRPPIYVEGSEKYLPLNGSIEKLITRISNGLRSTLSYFNASNLSEYRANVNFVRI